MTQGERLRNIRKTLNLTLEKFGEKLGVGKTAISKLEKGENSITDQMMLSICREYNVNENWLRTGEGDMFIKMTRNDELSQFVGQLMATEDDSFKKRLVSALAALDENGWDILEQFLDSIQKKEG
ncbi:MAG: helix-turn-helix transcriptional regulator [Anaerosacchariphilus sp.]